MAILLFLLLIFPNPFHHWHWPWHKHRNVVYLFQDVPSQNCAKDDPKLTEEGCTVFNFLPKTDEQLLEEFCVHTDAGYFVPAPNDSLGFSATSCMGAVQDGQYQIPAKIREIKFK